ncbi:MAG TPA: hypothetical protein VFM88_17915 [Vicinamibacteria bacterium]|nr:hypothetical protein [Vicinamibacteria bacterium]
MPSPPSLPRLLLYLAAGAAGVRLAVFVSVAFGRLTFPWEVEFLEGLTIDYAYTLLHGGNLYAPPSAHFAPNWYPPLHYVVNLAAFLAGGFSLSTARSVSIVSVLLALVLGARLLRRAGSSWAALLLFAATALSFYPATGYWYDVARVDSLATLLAVAGVAALASNGARPSGAATWIGGALLALAVFTKQTSVAVAGGALLFLLVERDAARLGRLVGALLSTSVPLALMLLVAYGADAAIVVTQPASHYFALRWVRVFAEFAWPMLPLFAAVGIALGVADGERARTLRLLLCTSGCAFLMGLLAMCKIGGQFNSSMPAIFLVSLGTALAADTLLARPRLRLCVPALALFALALPPWDYLDWIPTRTDRSEAEEILADMRAVDGPFLAYNASFVSTLTRGDQYPYWDRLYDWAGGQDKRTPYQPDPARYPEGFLRLIRERRFLAVYTNASDYLKDPVYAVISENYRPVRFWGSGMGPSVTDMRWRHCVPRVKWEPKGP